ncbi:MAG: D-glycero-beta-D-manno-heptose 1-phosphate adenylyltransferase [Bacteroidales bacterium]|nr:D-glycero-beta-D-manno-heptose 1-phosphate adenylyltransferase [Bacteroidales bacterium]
MNNLDQIQEKIFNHPSLKEQLNRWAEQQKKIVFTNGCFDLLHRGHIDYLSKAADLADVLLIGVNTDASVQRLKGKNRPLQDEQSRLILLASLSFVGAVILFDEDTPYDLIQLVQPDILVKGADYKAEDIVGYDIVMAKGGQVITLPFLPGYSTTAIETKIKQS